MTTWPWQQADPQDGQRVAKALTTYSAELQTCLTRLQELMSDALQGSTWSGQAATSASGEWASSSASLSNAINLWLPLSSALSHFSDVLETSQTSLTRAQSLAETSGLTIAENGTCVADTLQGPALAGSPLAAQQAKDTDAAQTITGLATPAIAAVTEADNAAVAAISEAGGECLGLLRAMTNNWATLLIPPAAYPTLSGLGLFEVDAPIPDPAVQPTSGPDGYDPLANAVTGTNWLGLVNPQCAPAGYSYTGGGFITGPDGQQYPLVIPNGPGGVNAGVGLDTLDGHDPGWTTTSDTIGGRLDGKPASGWLKFFGFWGGTETSGYGPSPDPEGLEHLGFSPDGVPSLDGVTPGDPRDPADYDDGDIAREKTEQDPGGKRAKAIDEATTRAQRDAIKHDDLPDDDDTSGAADPYSGGVGLAVDEFKGLALDAHLDDTRPRAYQVVTQVNADGRTRAIVTESQTFADPNTGAVTVKTYLISVGPDGKIVRTLQVPR